MGTDTLKPKIGDRKVIAGVDCVFIPDPWSYYVAFPCWCSVKELRKEGFKL